MEFGKHGDSEFVAIFRERPFQGQDPSIAKFIFIGTDANYPENLRKNAVFYRILKEYHENGVNFWRKYGVHHPFLLTDINPYGDKDCGISYHKRFRDIGYGFSCAEHIAFIELLNVPTVGRRGKDDLRFKSLLSKKYLDDLEKTILERRKKIIFLSSSAYWDMTTMIANDKQFGQFKWLKKYIKAEPMPQIYSDNNTSIFLHYHFSCHYKNQMEVLERHICQIRVISIDFKQNGCLTSC